MNKQPCYKVVGDSHAKCMAKATHEVQARHGKSILTCVAHIGHAVKQLGDEDTYPLTVYEYNED